MAAITWPMLSCGTFSDTDWFYSRSSHTATLLPDGRVLAAGGYSSGGPRREAQIYEHVPTTPLWTNGETMSTDRYDFAVTQLADGRVLVTGGRWVLTYHTSAEIYDPETETFTLTGSMTDARYHHAATLLPDGRVLVTGGYNSTDKALSGAEIYDPNSGTWATADNMSQQRENHTATLLPNGQVLIAGGFDIDNYYGYLNSVELYDPLTDTWTGADQLNSRRVDHTATLLPSGKVLVAGGTTTTGQLSYAEVYDPDTDAWHFAQSMMDERAKHAALLLPDGRVIVIGGRYIDGSTHYLVSVERYDPTTDTWDTLDSLSTQRENHVAALLLDGQVLVMGGDNPTPLSTTELYDPVLTHTAWQTTGSLSTARYIHAATLLADGRVLLSGGMGDTTGAELYDPATGTFTDTGSLSAGRFAHTSTRLEDGTVLVAGGFSGASATASAEVYNPTTGTFLATTGNMGDARHNHSATRLSDGQVLIAGGTDASSNYLASAELYDPASGTFTDTGSLARQRSGHTASLLPDGDVLIAGGIGYLAQSERYDPDTGTFADTSGTMAVGRIEHTATSLADGRVLVTGGRDNSSTPITSTEIYDPDTDAWTTTGGMNEARYNHAAALLPDGRVLVAGGYNNSSTYLTSAEVYDPASGTWTQIDSLSDARMDHTATTLDNGRVLVAGGADGAGLASAELYVEGRPWLEDVTSPIRVGDPLTATGATFRTRPEGSGGGHRSSATNYPLVQLMRLDNEQVRWLPVDASTPFSDTAFTSLPVEDWAAGYARATVFVNGIPSLSRMVQVLPQLGEVVDVDPAQNTHTAPLTTSLTISITEGLAVSNATSQTVIVQSGFQGPITGTFSSGSIVFDPAADFHPGELVETTVTTGVIADRLPLGKTHVWQFRTVVESGRGWFVDSGQALGSNNARTAELADLDGDGDLDVFVSNYEQANTAWLNDGSATYQQVWTDTVSGSSYPFGIALGDLDGDGDLDVYEAAMWSNDRVLMNNGDGTFSQSQSITSSDGRAVDLADLDGDGDLDAFVAAGSSGNPPNRVYLNDGTGTLVAGQSMSNRRSFGVALGDVDDDGDLDAFVANTGDGSPPEGPNEVWLNDGDGTFTDSGQSLGMAESWSVALGDLDGDGDLDAFVGNRDNEPNTVWFNDGTGTFSDSGQALGAGTTRQVKLGDVDGDGDLDAFVANSDTPNQVWINDGSGTFTPSGQDVGPNGQGASLGDVDDDGDLDVFVATSSADRVWFNQNEADLSIIKSVEPPVVGPGQRITYTLVYTNTGPEIASGVVITDHVPVTLTQVHYEATPPVTPTGSVSFTWDVGRLDVGQRGTITVTGVVSTGVTGVLSLTNEAVITSTLVFDADLDNNGSTISNTIDAIAPQVLSVSPAGGATDVALGAPVVITFSEAIDAGSLTYTVDPDPGGWSEAWNGAGTAVTLTHVAFTGETVYTVTVTAADDLAGNPLADTPYIWSFETERHLIYVPAVLNEFDG